MLVYRRSFPVNTHVTSHTISRVSVNETLQCLLSILITGKWAIILQIGFVGIQFNSIQFIRNNTIWFYVKKINKMICSSDILDLSKFLSMRLSFHTV
jgi:hypothetical protein